jgi:hypothetical protein
MGRQRNDVLDQSKWARSVRQAWYRCQHAGGNQLAQRFANDEGDVTPRQNLGERCLRVVEPKDGVGTGEAEGDECGRARQTRASENLRATWLNDRTQR